MVAASPNCIPSEAFGQLSGQPSPGQSSPSVETVGLGLDGTRLSPEKGHGVRLSSVGLYGRGPSG